MTRKLLKALGAHGLHATGGDRLLGTLSGRSRRPLVLCYHRVVEDVRAHPSSAPAMLVSAETLERQLDWVGRRYRFVGLDELARRVVEGSENGSRRGSARPLAAVTFDDGYADVYHHGFPLLRRKGIPSAIFLTTDLVGSGRLHTHDRLFLLLQQTADLLGGPGLEEVLRSTGADLVWSSLPAGPAERRLVEVKERLLALSPGQDVERLVALLEATLEERRAPLSISEQLREDLATMSWEMVREMHAAGVTVGSHTRTHRILPNEETADVMAELAVSKAALEARLGGEVAHLAYPGGQYCPRTVAAAEAAGYRYAYTTCYHGFPERPHLAIPRKTFWERSSAGLAGGFSPAVVSCQVEGVFDLVSPCRSDHHVRRRSGAPHRPTRMPEEATP